MDTNGNPSALSVLVVDEDAKIRHLLRLLFESEEFNVSEASNGAEAFQCLLRENPEFIVLDHQIPGMAEDEAASVLRSLAPGVCIVAFAAGLEEKPSWADAFLNKERIIELSPLLTKTLTPIGSGLTATGNGQTSNGTALTSNGTG